MIVATIIIMIAAVFAPLGIQINTEFFKAGENILNDTQSSLNEIQDASIRNSINETIISAKANTINNIEVNAAIYQYAWVLVLILGGLVAFLFSRQTIEVGSRGGGYV